jgi:hypothetical protein
MKRACKTGTPGRMMKMHASSRLTTQAGLEYFTFEKQTFLVA